MFFLQSGIGESKAQGDATIVESLDNALYEGLIDNTALSSSAVPYGRRENTVERSYLHTLTEEFGLMSEHFRKEQIKFIIARKIGKMKTYSHLFLLDH